MACALLSACTNETRKGDVTQASQCNCAGYFEMRPRPQWVKGDDVINGVYFSNGLEQCTGIKELDVKRADIASRTGLARIISTDIASEVAVKKTDYGLGAGHTEASVSSLQTSNALLENSQIYDRWVDVENCVVYSAVRISTQDVEASLRKLRQAEQRKLKNQTFFVSAKGKYAKSLLRHTKQLLSRVGVKKLVSKKNQQTHNVVVSLTDIVPVQSGRLVRVNMGFDIYDTRNQVIWSRQIAAKGVSFQGEPNTALIQKAISNAMRALEKPFRQALEKG